jgi:hypothetical protein
MTQLAPILTALCALALSDAAVAAAPAAATPQPGPAAALHPARPRADPTKQRDCEHAWAAQRIKKGSHRAFIRACVRHG